MTLFGSIVNRVLNEAKDGEVLKYEDIKSDYVNGPVYVYHMTGKSNLKGGILKSGWESYYNAWNSYGPGIYTCVLPSFDPKARVLTGGYGSREYPERDVDRQYIYGAPKDDPRHGSLKGVMVLCKTLKPHPFRSFLIFDEDMAKTIYKNHWRPLDQLKLILGKKLFKEKMASNYSLRTIGAYFDSAQRFIDNRDENDQQALDGYNKLYYRGQGAMIADEACDDPDINRKIRGLIFHGPGDGYVAIFRDYNALAPIGVSYDLGHTFEPLKTEAEFEDYQVKNLDVRSELGLDRFFFSKTNTIKSEYLNKLSNVPFKYVNDTFYGDYALVGNTDNPRTDYDHSSRALVVTVDNKEDWRWNFIYKPWINKSNNYNEILVSPNIWFDTVSTKWANNTANVMKNGILYYIVNKSGQFILHNDKGEEIGDLATLTDKDLNNLPQQQPINMSNVANQDTQNVNIAQQPQGQNQQQSSNTQTVAHTQRPKRKFGIRK